MTWLGARPTKLVLIHLVTGTFKMQSNIHATVLADFVYVSDVLYFCII